MLEKVGDEILVLTTVATREQAAAFGRGAVERRLAACVTCLGGAMSFYRWQSEAVTEEAEIVLLIKTQRQKLEALQLYFDSDHPYELPELLALEPTAISSAYRAWIDRELQPAVNERTSRSPDSPS